MKAHELLSRKDKWCQGHGALNVAGEPCHPSDEAAVKWCVLGAVAKCYGYESWNGIRFSQEANKLREEIVKRYHLYGWEASVTSFNDDSNTKFTQVKKLLKELNL